MHYNFDIKTVLAINKRFFHAWENMNFEWTDWPRIETFLRDAKYQQMIASMAPKTRSHSAPPGKQGGDAPKPKGAAFIDGVSVEFLKQNKLCMNYNKGTCPQKDVASHEHPFDKKKIIYHQCGACKKAGKTDETHGSHNTAKCGNKQPFRK